jgi:hypothetical protein
LPPAATTPVGAMGGLATAVSVQRNAWGMGWSVSPSRAPGGAIASTRAAAVPFWTCPHGQPRRGSPVRTPDDWLRHAQAPQHSHSAEKLLPLVKLDLGDRRSAGSEGLVDLENVDLDAADLSVAVDGVGVLVGIISKGHV